MKKLLFTLVTVSILFVLGCNENIIDPITQESLNKDLSTSAIIIQRGSISLEGILADPSIPCIEYYNIDGMIQFEHRLLSGPDPVATIELSLSLKATLTNVPGTLILLISGETKDTLVVNEFGYMFEKSFPILGGHLNLVCSFLVTSDNIVLSGKWLEIPVNDSKK